VHAAVAALLVSSGEMTLAQTTIDSRRLRGIAKVSVVAQQLLSQSPAPKPSQRSCLSYANGRHFRQVLNQFLRIFLVASSDLDPALALAKSRAPSVSQRRARRAPVECRSGPNADQPLDLINWHRRVHHGRVSNVDDEVSTEGFIPVTYWWRSKDRRRETLLLEFSHYGGLNSIQAVPLVDKDQEISSLAHTRERQLPCSQDGTETPLFISAGRLSWTNDQAPLGLRLHTTERSSPNRTSQL
jgi:hypothetical protein